MKVAAALPIVVLPTLLVLPAVAFSFSSSIKPEKQQLDIGRIVQGAASIAAASFVPLASPVAAASDVEAGQPIFQANCAVCHRGGRNLAYPKKTLEKEALDLYLDGGRTQEAVAALVTHGKDAMPAFRERLSEDSVADVAAYVIATSEAGWK